MTITTVSIDDIRLRPRARRSRYRKSRASLHDPKRIFHGASVGAYAPFFARSRVAADLAVNPRDRQEFVRLEARAAHQRSIDVLDPQEFLRVRRIHRAAVEDADALPGLAVAGAEPLADGAVHLADICGGR